MISNTTTSPEWTIEYQGKTYTIKVFTPETLPVEKRSFRSLDRAYEAAFKAGLQYWREI